MSYDFDKIISRENTGSVKCDFELCKETYPAMIKGDWLPMWVADMDFETAPIVAEALNNRTEHKIYGYTKVQEDFYSAITYWQKTRHNLKDVVIDKSNSITFPGIVSALSVCVRALTSEGDGIIIQMPVYNPFNNIINDNNRKVVDNSLINTHGYYTIDFLDLERKASDKNNKMMILCSPHNPVGRVWKKEELEKILEICYRNNIILISDEIHSDLIISNKKHHSIASFDKKYFDNIITLESITKTFNLAGLGLGYALVFNKELHSKIKKENEIYHWTPNIFSITATKAAYSEEGGKWIDALCGYLYRNYEYIEDFVKTNLKNTKLTEIEGTYLAWLDCSYYNIDPKDLNDLMTKEGVILSSGQVYGKGGDGFLRINFATPLANVKKAMEKVKKTLDSLE